MAGEMDYDQIFGVTEGEPAGSPSPAAPVYGEAYDSRVKDAGTVKPGESDDSQASAAGSVTRAKEKDGAAKETEKRNGRPQSPEENARFAARRRERERRAALKGRSPSASSQTAAAGLRPEETARAETEEPAAKPAGLSQDETALSAGPARMPGVPPEEAEPRAQAGGDGGPETAEQAGPVLEEQLARLRAERDFAVDQSIRRRIDGEVAEIARLDPAVRSFEDIRSSEAYARVGELVQSGISLVDAYKLVHFDRLTGNAAATARQAALNAQSGRAHLQSLGGTGGETAPAVPGEVLRAYRAIMPELSAREIEQHYHQYLRG